jgi:hypothetical protein
MTGLVKAKPLLASLPLRAGDAVGTRGSPTTINYAEYKHCNE